MSHALTKYEQYLRDKGNKPSSIETTTYRLQHWFKGDTPLESVTGLQIRRLYARRADKVSVDTHRNELAQLRAFFRWAVKAGLCSSNPAEDVEGVGRRSTGKTQLKRGEARDLFGYLVAKGDDKAIAVMMMLVCGMRVGEVVARKCGDVDVDADSVILYITEGKTINAARELYVPEPLASILADRVADKPKDAWLFPSPVEPDQHITTCWARSACKAACKAAGVPEVTPHGLRGTFASLAVSNQAALSAVAADLGHYSPSVTARHYLAPGTAESAQSARVLGVLVGNCSPDSRSPHNQDKKRGTTVARDSSSFDGADGSRTHGL